MLSVGPGGRFSIRNCPNLVRERAVDLVIANAENIAGGSGITANLFNKIRSYGVDVVTLGDHVYRKADIVPTLQTSERIVRPANLSAAAAGRRSPSSPPTAACQRRRVFVCWAGFT